jgi:hypothetical protein
MCHFRVEVERIQQGVATWACAERQQIEGRSMEWRVDERDMNHWWEDGDDLDIADGVASRSCILTHDDDFLNYSLRTRHLNGKGVKKDKCVQKVRSSNFFGSVFSCYMQHRHGYICTLSVEMWPPIMDIFYGDYTDEFDPSWLGVQPSTPAK